MRLFEIEPNWERELADELNKPYLSSLAAFVAEQRKGPTPIYPPQELMFQAFKKTPFPSVKVVIMGQDPYHGPGQAHGLSFSVPKGVKPPPSLKNIFKELHADLGIAMPSHGCLNEWAEQGVLLLNAALTVQQGEPMSHQGRGWEAFTDAVIARLGMRKDPIAFILWGKFAQEKCQQLKLHKQHLILTAAHPSPFSAHQGFFGCQHFSKVNDWLSNQGKNQINWEIS